MRFIVFLWASVGAMVSAGCEAEGTVAGGTGPSVARAPVHGEVRILSPGDGQVIRTAEIVVHAVQEVRGEPPQGRGRLQRRVPGGEWRSFGDEFPWSMQDHEILVHGPLGGRGETHVRVVVYGADPGSPFLASPPVLIELRPALTGSSSLMS